MLPNPAMRNSRSPTSRSFAKARFTPRGLMNGAMPSKTKNSPSAANRSDRFNDTGTAPGRRARRAALLGARALVGILQILEEFPIGCHDEQVAVFPQRALVRLQAAIEAVELGILRIGGRVSLRRFRIALTAYPQRIPFRVRQNLGALTLGGCPDADARALSFRAQAARDLREVLFHALVHASAHLVRKIDALHSHVDQLSTEARDVLARLPEHFSGHGGALRGDDLLERALRDDRLDAVLDDLGEALAGEILAPARRLKVVGRVFDAPLDVEVDDEAAVVVGEERLARVRLRQDTAVELHDLVPGPLAMQAG